MAALQSFTRAVAVAWVVAFVMHFRHIVLLTTLHETTEIKHILNTTDEAIRRLSVSWPEPASLLEVTSLHCGQPHLLVGSAYSTYSTQLLPGDEASEVMELGKVGVAALLCSMQGCDAIMRTPGNASWSLAPLEHCTGTATAEPELLPLPRTWRMLAAAWQGCHQPPCDQALLAGWDGDVVAVADLRRAVEPSSRKRARWTLDVRFRLHPGAGLCSASAAVCSTAHVMGRYSDLRALQLGRRGTSLAVLRGDGILDAWGLNSGALLGQWRLGAEYLAMCHDDVDLHLVRHESAGPVVEKARLPMELVEGI